MVEALSVLRETDRSINPLDKGKYEDLIKSHPYIHSLVDTELNRISDAFESNKGDFFAKFHQECSSKNLSLPGYEEVKSLFTEPFHIRNHMISLNLEAVVKDIGVVKFPLPMLSGTITNAFFSPDKTPGMIMFIEDVFCCVIFTHNGNINFVGGCNDMEVKYSLTKFIVLIHEAMVKINGNCEIKIKKMILQNRVITTKLSQRKIDIYHLADYINSKGICLCYSPEVHDLVRLTPLLATAPSIRIRLYSSGGIVGTGFRALYEIDAICYMLTELLRDYIRYVDGFGNSTELLKWNKVIYLERNRHEKNKIRKRMKTIERWNKIKKNENLFSIGSE